MHQRVDVTEAVRLIAERMPRYPAERVPLAAAVGRVLREPITAERDQPPFDRVTMDGICLRSAALAAGRNRFRIVGTQGAGSPLTTLDAEDACLEIMTGAALPAGADTIVPVERIRRAAGIATLEEGYTPAPGQFIHRQGSDHVAGQTVLEPGQRIRAPEAAILTIGGADTVAVSRLPRIAVISTGDELVEAGQPISPVQIRSSNDHALAAALAAHGFGPVTRARLPDEPDVLRREIARLHDTHDVLVLSGGVSMGQFDHVPQILADLGVAVVFHKVRQRPGLPMWFGTGREGRPVFALPGNPVSSLVCAVRYVLPALFEAVGETRAPPFRVPLAETVRFEPDLTWFLPVVMEHRSDGSMLAQPRPTNTSGDFVALGGTDGFVELPPDQALFEAGFVARFFPW